MSAEAFQSDANGKQLRCGAQEFVAGAASRQCTRPSSHGGPHAFPIDASHLACQQEVARLQVDRDAWRSAHDSAAGVILILEKSREDVRAKLASANRDAEICRAALRALILARADAAPGGTEAESAALLQAYRALAGES